MVRNRLPDPGERARVLRDEAVYRQPDEPATVGRVRAGSIVRAGVGPHMGRIAFTLISGEGAASGFVARNALAALPEATPTSADSTLGAAAPCLADPIATTALPVRVVAVRGRQVDRRDDLLVGEEPLQIRAAGPGQDPVDVAVTMRTPGEERELAAGFLITEGLVAPEDLADATWTFADPATHAQPHDELSVHLRVAFDASRVATRTAVATASCGICGKASIDDVAQRCGILPPGPVVARSTLERLPDVMRAAQAVFEQTGGVHAVALFRADGQLIRVREDVGRHNALDKLVGAAALAAELPLRGCVVMVSGRVSFEIVQKAAIAGIAVLAAVSAPTDLAVATAHRVGMTLVGFLRGDGFNVYTGEARIDLDA